MIALALFELVQLLGALRRGWLRSWLAAAGRTAGSLPEIVARRRAVQQGRRLPDREILVGGPLPFRTELPRGRAERAVLAALDATVGAYLSLATRLL